MQNFIHVNLITQELDRELNKKRLERFDPDGLAQYEIWDHAFGGPTFRERIVSLVKRVRRPQSKRPKQYAHECLPQA